MTTYGFLQSNDPITIGEPVIEPTVLSEMEFGLRRTYLAKLNTVTGECVPVYDMGCFHNNCQWCFYHTEYRTVIGSSHLRVRDMPGHFTESYAETKSGKYIYLCRVEPNMYTLNAEVKVKFMVKEPSSTVRYLVSPCHHLTVGDTYTSLDLAGSILYDKEGALQVAKNAGVKTTIYEVEPNGLSLRILSVVEPFAIRAADTRVKILTAIDEIILAASSDTDMVFDIETRSHGEHGLGIKIGIIQTED